MLSFMCSLMPGVIDDFLLFCGCKMASDVGDGCLEKRGGTQQCNAAGDRR